MGGRGGTKQLRADSLHAHGSFGEIFKFKRVLNPNNRQNQTTAAHRNTEIAEPVTVGVDGMTAPSAPIVCLSVTAARMHP